MAIAMLHAYFPHPALAEAILPYAFDARDGAHDEAHVLRVWRNVAQITHREGGDTEILVAATILHDCVWIDKASPERGIASSLGARQAKNVLSVLGWPHDRISQVCHSIEAHSFSAGIAPISLEAKILQDADRLDAIGWIGLRVASISPEHAGPQSMILKTQQPPEGNLMIFPTR